jgi:trans-aconitate methyltransferase
MTARLSGAGPDFYDALMDDPSNDYLQDTGGVYEDLYRRAASLVPGWLSVCDLGCGTGRFARILLDTGHDGGYIGLDFAPRLVEQAREHCPDGSFLLADLRDSPIPAADVYVALEVLEHLEDDLVLLDSLPHAALMVLSVPSFESASHLRCFPRPGDASRRYEDLLFIETATTVPLPSGAFFHLLAGSLR